MRKLAFLFIAFLVSCAAAPDNGPVPFEQIRDGWKTKTCSVKNGGENPSVMDLLKAFNSVWRTQIADSVIFYVGDKTFVSYDDETGASDNLYVDTEDFNSGWYNHGDTGDEAIEFRSYSRENGHTLFAVCLERSNPEEIAFCCFYDYDPASSVMTPEDEPYAGFKPTYEDSGMNYMIAQDDYGQDVILMEIPKDDEAAPLYHHFVFNGMKHEFEGTSYEYIYPEYEEDYDPLPDDAVLRAESDHYWFYTSVARPASEEDPEVLALWIKDKGEAEETHWICTTFASAEPKWSLMKDGNAIPVRVDSGDIACADNIIPVPWDPTKFYIDGCPDARNIWSYILDVSDPDDIKAIQFPSTEGFISFDVPGKKIHLGAYGYHPEGGRYSIEQIYTIEGKFISQKVLSDE